MGIRLLTYVKFRKGSQLESIFGGNLCSRLYYRQCWRISLDVTIEKSSPVGFIHSLPWRVWAIQTECTFKAVLKTCCQRELGWFSSVCVRISFLSNRNAMLRWSPSTTDLLLELVAWVELNQALLRKMGRKALLSQCSSSSLWNKIQIQA